MNRVFVNVVCTDSSSGRIYLRSVVRHSEKKPETAKIVEKHNLCLAGPVSSQRAHLASNTVNTPFYLRLLSAAIACNSHNESNS